MNREAIKLLVTGATGFVGASIARRMKANGVSVRCAVRRVPEQLNEFCDDVILISDINAHTDWAKALDGVSVVVHAAARVHVMAQSYASEGLQYQMVNVDGTMALARQAAASGVKRFIFISSAKVNGESTEGRGPFLADEPSTPQDAYAKSKSRAEVLLMALANSSGMEVVIIRPPLVYGPGVKANFQKLVKLATSRLPLPFALATNQRSLVYVENLSAFVEVCIAHPAAANQVFMISDSQDFSVRDMLKCLGAAGGHKPLLIPVPVSLFRLVLSVIGKKGHFERVFGTLLVDKEKARRLLGWSAPYSAEESLAHTAKAILRSGR